MEHWKLRSVGIIIKTACYSNPLLIFSGSLQVSKTSIITAKWSAKLIL